MNDKSGNSRAYSDKVPLTIMTQADGPRQETADEKEHCGFTYRTIEEMFDTIVHIAWI